MSMYDRGSRYGDVIKGIVWSDLSDSEIVAVEDSDCVCGGNVRRCWFSCFRKNRIVFTRPHS